MVLNGTSTHIILCRAATEGNQLRMLRKSNQNRIIILTRSKRMIVIEYYKQFIVINSTAACRRVRRAYFTITHGICLQVQISMICSLSVQLETVWFQWNDHKLIKDQNIRQSLPLNTLHDNTPFLVNKGIRNVKTGQTLNSPVQLA